MHGNPPKNTLIFFLDYVDNLRLWSDSRYRRVVNVRKVVCFWVVREGKVGMTSLAERFGILSIATSKFV